MSAERPADQAPRSTEATQPGAVGVAADFDAHPEACWPGAGTQTGSGKSLVTWVTGTLLAGWVFADDGDLGAHCDAWLTDANTRPSQAICWR